MFSDKKVIEAKIWNLAQNAEVAQTQIDTLRESHLMKTASLHANITRIETSMDLHGQKIEDITKRHNGLFDNHVSTHVHITERLNDLRDRQAAQTAASETLIESVKILTQIFTSLITEGRVTVGTRKSKRRKR